MLASLLRECASIVEKNESSALLFKAVESLNAYAEHKSKVEHGTNGTNGTCSPISTTHATKESTTKNININPSTTTSNSNATKPAFQRPINKSSNLIANGWLEQQRRSTLRMVWKQILASLVEARRPGEDTTLWIQREVEVPNKNENDKSGDKKGKVTLDALHQIPMKWLLNVRYLDDYGDFRFCLKVYNVQDEFVFRTPDEDSCKEWVATLTSAMEASRNQTLMKQQYQMFQEAGFPDLLSEENNKNNSNNNMNGANVNGVNGSNGTENHFFPDINMQTGQSQNQTTTSNNRHQQPKSPPSTSSSTATASAQASVKKKSLKELIAIAHGAGYNTRGMERADLEKIANHYAPASEKIPKQQPQQTQSTQQSQQSPPPPPPTSTATKTSQTEDEKIKQQIENMRLKQEKERKERNQKMQEDLERERKHKQQQQQQEEEMKRKKEETEKRAQHWEQNWNHSNNNSSHSSNSNTNGHQQYHQSQQQAQNPPPPPSAPPYEFHTQQQQQQQQKQQNYPQQQNPQQHPSRPFPMNTNQSSRNTDPTSPINQKYHKQISTPNIHPSQKQQDEQTIISNIKRNILIAWALIPPQYNTLKPIDQLLLSIHTVFPPFSNVKGHAYFHRWKVISRDELFITSNNNIMNGNVHVPDETKLKRVQRKLRVFLHPDRLPKDFDNMQTFVCKMLWDVSNDALEEFMKNKDDLDWINR